MNAQPSPQPSPTRSRVTTHVLDATQGRPAAGVPARLEALRGDVWEVLSENVTDGDGRIAEFGPVDLDPGSYRVWFDVAAYFDALGQASFYPEVSISFNLDNPTQHYHVPLLLSPYAYSTYRGS